jgi:hypothetical protein
MYLCNSVYDDVIDLPIETLAFTMRWYIGTRSMCCAMMSGRCVWVNMYRMGTADVQRVQEGQCVLRSRHVHLPQFDTSETQ